MKVFFTKENGLHGMRERMVDWLEQHPKVMGAVFSSALFLTEMVEPLGCVTCGTTGP